MSMIARVRHRALEVHYFYYYKAIIKITGGKNSLYSKYLTVTAI